MIKPEDQDIRNKIFELQKTAIRLEPDSRERASWNNQVVSYADDFLDQIEQLKAYVETEDQGVGILNRTIKEDATDLNELLVDVKKYIDRPGLNPASGGHLGYIPGGGVFPTALGDYLADITNRYAGIFFGGPGAVRMENLLIRWMCDIVGYPKNALGNLTSGGSIANLIAIATARDTKGIRSKDVENSVIYLTQQAHHSVQKAIRIAGLNEAILSYIPLDDRFRMNVHALKKNIEKDVAEGRRPFLVIASAGTTDTGAIDPLDAIAIIAKEHDLWYHIDAAYGGFFILTEEIKNEFKGIEKSDSITIDPHKGLFLSYGTGAILIKDVEALKKTHYYMAGYMQDAVKINAEPSPADLSPELTKHFRGMRMWLSLQLFGLKPFRACLSEKLWLCRYFYEEIQKIGFEVGPYPELSVMIYRYVPKELDANEFNAKIVEGVRLDGRVFVSSTTLNEVYWIRLAVLSFRTRLSTIDLCLEILKKQVDILEKVNIE